MAGAGALAPHLVRAHCAVRRYVKVSLWNRNPARAEELAAGLRDLGVAVKVIEDLEAAARAADVISCATLSAEPLIKGAWLKAGAHLDLVGGFTPRMREADDEAVGRAEVYCDTRAGALKEAGDLTQPIERGIITAASVRGDLFDLVRGEAPLRSGPEAITLFKSVGYALEDLAAAELVADSVP